MPEFAVTEHAIDRFLKRVDRDQTREGILALIEQYKDGACRRREKSSDGATYWEMPEANLVLVCRPDGIKGRRWSVMTIVTLQQLHVHLGEELAEAEPLSAMAAEHNAEMEMRCQEAEAQLAKAQKNVQRLTKLLQDKQALLDIEKSEKNKALRMLDTHYQTTKTLEGRLSAVEHLLAVAEAKLSAEEAKPSVEEAKPSAEEAIIDLATSPTDPAPPPSVSSEGT